MKKIMLTEEQLKQVIETEIQFVLAKLGFPRDGFSIAHHKDGSTDDTEIWKNYWEEQHPSHHFPSEPHICPSCLVKRNIFVGAHVIVGEDSFIIPTCKHCNDKFKGDKADNHYFYVKTEDMVRAPED